MTVPEFHLYLPQMRLSMDAMVEKARAAEAAGFVGMAGICLLYTSDAADE